MARGHFQPTDHPYQILFSGQLKKRVAVDSYTTFTLVPTSQVLTALERFRTHPTISHLRDASIEEINKLNTPINRSCKQYFQDTALVPVLVGEAGVWMLFGVFVATVMPSILLTPVLLLKLMLKSHILLLLF